MPTMVVEHGLAHEVVVAMMSAILVFEEVANAADVSYANLFPKRRRYTRGILRKTGIEGKYFLACVGVRSIWWAGGDLNPSRSKTCSFFTLFCIFTHQKDR
jgi:hypothetical protein